MMEQLATPEEQQTLLRWARLTIERVVRGDEPPCVQKAELTPALLAPHAAFVTLTKGGELRGCIGKMDFSRPLWENVMGAAVASALEDPRFPAVTEDELQDLALEISVLEPPVDLPDPAKFDPMRHGIIIEKGWHHGLLLPQVAREHGWDATRTLEAVCWKAGLPEDAWKDPEARLQVFEADVFGERDS